MNSSTNYSNQRFDFKLSNQKFYDFQLADHSELEEIDLSKSKIVEFTADDGDGDLLSNVDWKDKVALSDLLSTFGLTGVDNGAITYTSDSTLEHTYYTIPTTLVLSKVDGVRRNLDYTVNQTEEGIEFKGGFYQGFYKLDGYDYQVLPNRYKKGWTIHTKLKPTTDDTTNSLNSISNDTDGFFFYIGTRAENKFWNTFEGLNPEDDTTTKETTFEGVTEQDFIIPLNPPRVVIKKEENQFLIYGRSDGNTFCGRDESLGFGTHRADKYEQNAPYYYKSNIPLNKIDEVNPFLKYGRSDGKPICGDESDHVDFTTSDGTDIDYGTAMASDDGSRFDLSTELDLYKDIVDNAFGLRIKSDGSIGYRRIISRDCDVYSLDRSKHKIYDNYIVKEEYAPLGIPKDAFSEITIKWVADKELTCEFDKVRNGKLQIYVGGLLRHTFEDVEEIVPRALYEHVDKQLGVPFNISIGGGTQGLLESMTFDGPDPSDDDLPLRTHFGGSFIGVMDGFKIFDNPLTWCEIKSI
jgi:hypothetical protein